MWYFSVFWKKIIGQASDCKGLHVALKQDEISKQQIS